MGLSYLLSKIAEKCIFEQIIQNLNAKPLSTEMVISFLWDDIKAKLSKGSVTGAVFFFLK